jgi:hypothetical protein
MKIHHQVVHPQPFQAALQPTPSEVVLMTVTVKCSKDVRNEVVNMVQLPPMNSNPSSYKLYVYVNWNYSLLIV